MALNERSVQLEGDRGVETSSASSLREFKDRLAALKLLREAAGNAKITLAEYRTSVDEIREIGSGERKQVSEEVETILTALGIDVGTSENLSLSEAPTPARTEVRDELPDRAGVHEPELGVARPVPSFDAPAPAAQEVAANEQAPAAPQEAPAAPVAPAREGAAAPEGGAETMSREAYDAAVAAINERVQVLHPNMIRLVTDPVGKQYLDARAAALGAKEDFKAMLAALEEKAKPLVESASVVPEAANDNAPIEAAVPLPEAAVPPEPVAPTAAEGTGPAAPREVPIVKMDEQGNVQEGAVPVADVTLGKPSADAEPLVDLPRWGSTSETPTPPPETIPSSAEESGQPTPAVAEAAVGRVERTEMLKSALTEVLATEPVFADLSDADRAALIAAQMQQYQANDNETAPAQVAA